MGKAAVALVIGGVLGAGTAAGFGIASAVTAAPSPSSAASSSAAPGPADQPGARRHPALRRFLANRVEHGELTVKGKDGKPVVVDVQRGQVTAVSATSITLKSEDGFTASYTVDSDTRVRVGGTRKAIGDVKVGNTAGLMAKKENGTPTAYLVVVR
jgi:hypothetical protein